METNGGEIFLKPRLGVGTYLPACAAEIGALRRLVFDRRRNSVFHEDTLRTTRGPPARIKRRLSCLRGHG